MTNLRGRRTLSLAAAAVTVLWLIGVAWYIFEFIGADALAGMLPHELGLVVAGITAPLLLLWLLVAFVVRGQALKEHTDLLASRLAELTFPDSSAEHRINSIAEALRRQATAAVTPSARNRARSSRVRDNSSASTRSVSCPSVGAGRRISDLPAVWSRIGEIGTRVLPRRGWSMSTQKPRASRWGSYATSRAVFTGAQGTCASLSRFNTSSLVRLSVQAPTMSSISCMCLARLAVVE